MINQTEVLSIINVDTHGVAIVTAAVNQFIASGIVSGYTNFHVLPVVVTPSALPNQYWYTVQVNYYNPAVQAH